MSEVVKVGQRAVVVPPKPEGLVGRGFFEPNVENDFLWKARRAGEEVRVWDQTASAPVLVVGTGMGLLASAALSVYWSMDWFTSGLFLSAGLGLVPWAGLKSVLSWVGRREWSVRDAVQSVIAEDLGAWLLAQRIQVDRKVLDATADDMLRNWHMSTVSFTAVDGSVYELFKSSDGYDEFGVVLWDVQLVESAAMRSKRKLPVAAGFKPQAVQGGVDPRFGAVLDLANALSGSVLDTEDAYVVDRALKELYELSQVTSGSLSADVDDEVSEALVVLKAELDEVAGRQRSSDERKVRGVTEFIRSRKNAVESGLQL